MALTNIGDQLTPGRPIEVTFAAETGTPSENQEVLLIGHAGSGAASGSVADYASSVISNSGDLNAASGEAATKFGQGSELQKMVLAAIRANQGQSSLPQLKCIKLPSSETGFGPSDEALTTAQRLKAEFIVSPYDGDDDTLRGKLEAHAELVSGAQRVENNQYGSMGVAATRSVVDPADLPKPDTQFLYLAYLRDTGTGDEEPAYSLGELAAAVAARTAQQGTPFNPVDDVVIGGLAAPAKDSDRLTIGAGLESETVLQQGWTPLKVFPNGDVGIVRSVTARRTVDGAGVTDVTSYYDVQDFQVLYFWRKALFARFSQADMKRRKASAESATAIKAEVIRLALLFQEQGMFQAVNDLAKLFIVERSASDRHRFDIKTPVNVIPGLHVIATNIEATTQFDTLTV